MKTNSLPLAPAHHRVARCWLGLLALSLAVVWIGCKHTSQVATDPNPAGTYTLVSVDGKPVPCRLTHEGANVIMKSASFIISTNGTCDSKSVFCVESYPDVHREVKATYTLEGSKLTMKWEGAGMTTGNIEGNKFTMNNEGMIMVYQK